MEDNSCGFEHINIYVGNADSGNRVYEQLPIERKSKERYVAAASPALVFGLAKGDEFFFDEFTGEFELVKRGHNVCVQLYFDPSTWRQVDELAIKLSNSINGTLDGKSDKIAVFSVHVSQGFDAIENALDEFVSVNSGANWCYGNVYDERDEPLNWWLS